MTSPLARPTGDGAVPAVAAPAGPRRMRGSDRRSLIQKTAAELFSVGGYSRTTMEEIARAAGIKKASLYYFYRSKETLLADVFRAALELPQREFDAIIASDLGNIDKLQRMIAVLVQSYDELLPLMVTFTRSSLDSIHDPACRQELKSLQRHFEATWEDVIAAAIRAGELRADLDVKLVSFGLIGMINWMYKWYRPGGRKTPREVARTFAALALEGLATTGHRPRTDAPPTSPSMTGDTACDSTTTPPSDSSVAAGF